jgi:Asp-tRNA(Asn)/Glu-tRNA(Gln) amidotransferase A subunit family amidase
VDVVFSAALERLAAMGHDLEEVELPLVAMQEPWTTMVLVLIAALAEEFSAQELSRLEPGNLAAMIRGASISGVDHVQATARAGELAKEVLERLEPFDAFVTPTVTLPPYPVDRLTPDSDVDDMFQALFDWGEFMLPFNVTGQPGISVPAGFTTDGLPVGLHLVGPPNGEATILPLAAAFERASIADGVPTIPPLGADARPPSFA